MSGERIIYEWHHARAIDVAERNGFEVVRTSPDRLLLDIDREDDLRKFATGKQLLESHFGLREISRWRSKSGKGWHIIMQCNPCDFTTRLLLHACLGSDLKREALGLMMQADGENEISFLFKPK